MIPTDPCHAAAPLAVAALVVSTWCSGATTWWPAVLQHLVPLESMHSLAVWLLR